MSILNALCAQIDPASAGYVTGRILFVVAMLAGIAKCVSISLRPTANKKCVLGFVYFLIGWLVIALSGTFARTASSLQALLMALSVLGFVSLIFGVVQAIRGLVEYSRQRELYTQGRAHAISTLVLSGLFVVLAAIGASKGTRNRTAMGNQPRDGQRLAFEDFNFRFTAPGRPWVQIDAPKLNRFAKVAFLRSLPQTYSIVIAEQTGNPDLGSEALADLAVANMKSVTDSARVAERFSYRAGPLQGIRLHTEAESPGHRIFYVHWVFATNGWCYQLVTWGSQQERGSVIREADGMIRRFSLIDPGRRTPIGGQPAREDFVSTNLQFAVRWKNSDWRAWPDLEKSVPAASFGVLSADDAAFVVSAVWLMDLQPHPEAIYQGLLGVIGLQLDSIDSGQRREINDKGMAGLQLETKRLLERGQEFTYRVKMLHGGGFAYLAGAWAESKHPRREELLNDALARVEFLEPRPVPREPSRLNPGEQRSQRLILNAIGLAYHGAGQFDQAARFFKSVVDLGSAPTNSPYLQNLVQAWMNAGKYREALGELDGHSQETAASIELRADQAFLQAELGRTDLAITNYARLFDTGYRDERHFRQYVAVLNMAREPEAVLAVIENFLRARDSADVRLLQAGVLRRQKKFDQAITLLQAQREKHPFHSGLAQSLADTLIQATRHTEALAVSQELIRQQANSASGLFLKGRAELGLKWYRQAKESFERAAKEAPADPDIKSHLEFVSALLGEGANSAIKEPIAAVVLPATLLSPLAPVAADYARDDGAYVARRITAISFVRNKELKTTEFIEARTLNAAGVSAFSTFQVAFNPLSEEIHVNRLEVKDAAGGIVSTGKVSDYYVLDDRFGQVATTRKVLNIPVSGLQPGYSVEITTTRRELGRVEEMTFLAHQFSRPFPVRDSVVFLQGDTGAVRFASSPKLDPERLPDGLYWRVKDPPVLHAEPLQQAPHEYLPMLWLSDASVRWSSVATNYLGSIREHADPSPALRDLARQISAAATNELQKITAIAAYVQTNYTYKAIEFGRRARVPQLPADIIRNKYGDCKDHALLAQQLLRAAGIPASLALASHLGAVRQDLPSLDQFDHMIVYLPGSGRFLDCTYKGSPADQTLPAGLAGNEVLILDEQDPRFVRIPGHSARASVIRSDRFIHVTNLVDAVVDETLILEGIRGGYLREYLRGQSPAGRQSYVAGLLGSSGELLKFAVDNLENSQSPLAMRLTYLLRGQFHQLDREMVGTLPSSFERIYLATEPIEKRQSPFELDVPLAMEGSLSFRIPAGYRFKPQAVPSQRLEHRFVTCETKADVGPETLKVTYQLHGISGRFPAADYADYCRTMSRAMNALAPRFVCERSP